MVIYPEQDIESIPAMSMVVVRLWEHVEGRSALEANGFCSGTTA